MKRTVFITGATGVVGAYLLAEFWKDPAIELHLLVRDAEGETAGERVRRVLEFLGLHDRPGGCELHRGDLRLDDLGLGAAKLQSLRSRITDVVHAAADIGFDDRRSEGRTTATNVEGTRRVLEICGPEARLFHVSTAYVAGQCPRPFFEDEWDVGQEFRNDYERSKLEGERLVRAAFADRPGLLTILRPAIVLGETGSARTFQFSSLYRLLGFLWLISRGSPGARLSFPYDPDATQNYVPVDALAAWCAEVFRNPVLWGQTYHLASDDPVTNREMGLLLGDLLGLDFAPLAAGVEPPNRESERFVRRAREYLPYLASHPRFVCTNRCRLGGGQGDFRVDGAFLRLMLAYCLETGWGRKLAHAR